MRGVFDSRVLEIKRSRILYIYMPRTIPIKAHRPLDLDSNITTMSPNNGAMEALKARSRTSSISSLDDFDESYFYQNYVPLSSLPTPPLSYSTNTSRQQSPESLFPGETLDAALLGIAPPLPNMVYHILQNSG
jgi:hypothetical protein